MKKLTATDLKARTGEAIEAALREPVTIVKNGRDLLVIITHEEYEDFVRFKKHSRKKKPFPFGIGRDHPSINKSCDHEEFFRPMSDTEYEDFLRGRY